VRREKVSEEKRGLARSARGVVQMPAVVIKVADDDDSLLSGTRGGGGGFMWSWGLNQVATNNCQRDVLCCSTCAF
jgi:hypothetical protein